jgi:hypothetical protein
MKYSYPIMHFPNIQAICKDIPTLTQNTHRDAIEHMMHKQVECISSKTYTSSKHAYVCLLTSGRSGRRRRCPAARIVGCRKGQVPCGEEGGNSQAYTLSPSQRLCVYVSACARVSVCQCCTSACLPQQATTSIDRTHHNAHRYANARNMHLKLRSYTSYGKV